MTMDERLNLMMRQTTLLADREIARAAEENDAGNPEIAVHILANARLLNSIAAILCAGIERPDLLDQEKPHV